MKIVFWRSAPITTDDSRLSVDKNVTRVWFKELALEYACSRISLFYAKNLLWLHSNSNNENVRVQLVEINWDISLKLRPIFDKWWRFGSDHGYYDGPHCCYHIGPFVYYTNTNLNCKKCNFTL